MIESGAAINRQLDWAGRGVEVLTRPHPGGRLLPAANVLCVVTEANKVLQKYRYINPDGLSLRANSYRGEHVGQHETARAQLNLEVTLTRPNFRPLC